MRTPYYYAMMMGSLMAAEPAADLMLTAQQNALVGQYCAVCHTDTAKM